MSEQEKSKKESLGTPDLEKIIREHYSLQGKTVDRIDWEGHVVLGAKIKFS